jgi:peptidoglycan/xylan/chitin deacetylase (PgdA/CDA1 family)
VNGRAVRWAWALARRERGVDGGGSRMTILRYHRVYADGAAPLYRLGVAESLFAAQVEWLRARATVVRLSEGLARLQAGKPGHWVALTFDDGYADNVERALPRLQRAGLPATFYLTAGAIEQRKSLWWDDLAWAIEQTSHESIRWNGRRLRCDSQEEKREALLRMLPDFRVHPGERERRLEAAFEGFGVRSRPACELMDWEGARQLVRAGMELGAHSLQHPHLGLLPANEQRREIEESRRLIEERAGVLVESFAYPGGDYSHATLEILRELETKSAVTTEAGTNRPGADPLRLLRRGLTEGACLNPAGGFSAALASAELEGAFDDWRRRRVRV